MNTIRRMAAFASALFAGASLFFGGSLRAAEVPQINVLLQPRWNIGGAKGGEPNTFFVKRSEIQIGSTIEEFDWKAMIDPASSTLFKDALIRWNINVANGAVQYIQFGQYKIPLTLEGTYSSSKIKIHDRPLINTAANYGDARSIGVETGGVIGGANYRLMLANGIGEDRPPHKDANGHKAFVARAWVPSPFSKDLMLAVNGAVDTSTHQWRVGTDVAWESGPYSARAEVMTGDDFGLRRTGYWVQGAYRIPGTKWEPVARFDTLDSSKASEDGKDLTLGVSYYISPRVKIQASGTHKMFSHGDDHNVGNVQITVVF